MSITKINNLGITDGTIVNADINASAGITLAKLSGVNDAKAWVNFNGTGTPAIRASFNVTSITDNGTGDYTVNFTNALSDANYAAFCGGQDPVGGAWIIGKTGGAYSTTQFRVEGRDGSINYDAAQFCVAIFR